ncbi:MAG: YdcF family protein, partial [Cyanobacteria bacterium J06597_16]
KLLQLRYLLLGLGIAIALYFTTLPIKLAIAQMRTPQPQAILTLGGGKDREVVAANLAAQNPELAVWVSSGSSYQASREVFKAANIDFSKVHLDYEAVDTVTNFTTLVEQLQQQNIEHVYLLTSDFHMRRAKAIAFVVLGSRGIAYTPYQVASQQQPESTMSIVRDVSRAVLWLATGKTGAHFGSELVTLAKAIHLK